VDEKLRDRHKSDLPLSSSSPLNKVLGDGERTREADYCM
jgi:hypothetical protein